MTRQQTMLADARCRARRLVTFLAGPEPAHFLAAARQLAKRCRRGDSPFLKKKDIVSAPQRGTLMRYNQAGDA
jgi:hypothetical protein